MIGRLRKLICGSTPKPSENNKTMKSQEQTQRLGPDAPPSSREHDHLNRWAFAQEIYGIATTGPTDWSVRVGIYGEWGTGKTTVLDFIESSAKADEHVTLRFNPWEFSDSRALWHSFVMALETELKKHAPTWKSYDPRRLKKLLSSVANRVTPQSVKINAVVDDPRVTLPLLGIEILKDFVSFNKDDLRRLMKNVPQKRVLILIDDLDRTSSTVVPEILFALKEVMDIPGMAFICAFDPVVVGEVLKERHPGFGDGLRFLEKIIDYPRWLPVPTQEGLVRLALADAKDACSYVPQSALECAVPLLPPNPRAVRQYIRMLTLLRSQIERHYPTELNWPSILAANVLKVRHPRIAHSLLADGTFWQNLEMNDIFSENGKLDLDKAITRHLEDVSKKQGVSLTEEEREQIAAAMNALCSQISPLLGFDATNLAYQMHLAENPKAVTGLEFQCFLRQWLQDPKSDSADGWISNHAATVGRLYAEVFSAIFDATLKCYEPILQGAERVLDAEARPVGYSVAESVLYLLECLSDGLGRTGEPERRIDARQFGSMLEQFLSLGNSAATAQQQEFRQKEEALLMKVVQTWRGMIDPLIQVLHPFRSGFLRHVEGREAKSLHRRLCAEALPAFGKQLTPRFREAGFVKQTVDDRKKGLNAIEILRDVSGPMWGNDREAALDLFRSEAQNDVVRENIFELFHWMNCELESENESNKKPVQAFLQDKDVAPVLWDSLTSKVLSPRAVRWLETLPQQMQELGNPLVIPKWWDKQLSASKLTKAPPPPANDFDHENGNAPAQGNDTPESATS